MEIVISEVTEQDKEALAGIRVVSMRESLEAINRFDADRARARFIEAFKAQDTRSVSIDGQLAGFYALTEHDDHLYLDHLYIHPDFQGCGLGSRVMEIIKAKARASGLPVRLGALRGSRSNVFYRNHGFEYSHEEEWDIYYEYKHR